MGVIAILASNESISRTYKVIFGYQRPQKAEFGLNLGMKSIENDKIDNIDTNNAIAVLKLY